MGHVTESKRGTSRAHGTVKLRKSSFDTLLGEYHKESEKMIQKMPSRPLHPLAVSIRPSDNSGIIITEILKATQSVAPIMKKNMVSNLLKGKASPKDPAIYVVVVNGKTEWTLQLHWRQGNYSITMR